MQSLLTCMASGLSSNGEITDTPQFDGQAARTLTQLAMRHRLVPQTMHGLQQQKTDLRAFADLNRHHQQCLASGMLMKAELARIGAAFDADSIPLMALKGPVVELQVYPTSQFRQFRDLDIIVPPGAVVDACRILTELGFGDQVSAVAECRGTRVARLTRLHKHVHGTRHHGKHPTVIELHWRAGGTPRMSNAWEKIIWHNHAEIRVGDVGIKTLNPHALIVFLAWHGGRHRWKRLSWLYDFGQAIQKYADTDWRNVLEIAKTLKLVPYLTLASELLREMVPSVRQPSDLRKLAHAIDVSKAIASCRHAIIADELYYEHQPLSSFRWYYDLSHCITDRLQAIGPLLSPKDDDVINHGWLKGRVNRVRQILFRIQPNRYASGSAQNG